MNQKNISIAEAYYTAMGEKNIAGMEKYLHPAIEFFSPYGQTSGKEAVLASVKGMFSIFTTLTIRAKFGSDDQAMLACDYEFAAPIGIVPTAILITLKDDLIIRIQLYFDARPFEKR